LRAVFPSTALFRSGAPRASRPRRPRARDPGPDPPADPLDRHLPSAVHRRDRAGGRPARPDGAGEGGRDGGGRAPTLTMTPPILDWMALGPVLIVTVTGFACLLLDTAPSDGRKGVLAGVGVLGLGGALVVSLFRWGGPAASFQRMLALDDFALFFNLVVCAASGLVLLLSVDYMRRQGAELGEYYVVVLFATLGMMLMAGAADLLIVFLGLELMSVSLYVLAGFFRARARANEAAMKYFLLGAFASGFFLYGIALLYGATGTTSLARLGETLAAPGAGRDPMVLAGLALLL